MTGDTDRVREIRRQHEADIFKGEIESEAMHHHRHDLLNYIDALQARLSESEKEVAGLRILLSVAENN